MFKNVEELYGDNIDHLKPEIIPVLKSCSYANRLSGEIICSALTTMVSSGSVKSFAGSPFSNSGLVLKQDLTAGDACATACSSCMCYEQVAPMGTKVERFTGDASVAKCSNRPFENHADLVSPPFDYASEGRHHTSSDTSHLISACSSHGSFSENEKGEGALRDLSNREASPGWGSLKAPIFHDNCILDQSGTQRAVECLGDNLSCISESNYVKIRDGDINGDSDRKNVSRCSSSANSVSEGEKAFDNQHSSCCLSGTPFDKGDTTQQKKLKFSPKNSLQENLSCPKTSDSFVDTTTFKEEQSECSEGQVQSSFATENASKMSNLMGDKHSSGGTLRVDSGKNKQHSAEVRTCSNKLDSLKLPGKIVKEAQTEKTTIESVPSDCGNGSGIIEYDVKVCDICGDVGREHLLAICSNCTDGAEHTYCMRIKLAEVPIGDWMCEECTLCQGTQSKEQDKFEKGVENKLPTNVIRHGSQISRAIQSKNNFQSDRRFQKIRAHKINPHSLCAKSPSGGVEATSIRKRLLGSSMPCHPSKRLKHLPSGQSTGNDAGTAKSPSTLGGKSSLLSLQSQMVKGPLSKSNTFPDTRAKESLCSLKPFLSTSPKGSLCKPESFPDTGPKGSLYKTKSLPDKSPKGSLFKSKSLHNNGPNGYLSKSKTFPDRNSKESLSKTKFLPSSTLKEKVQQSREGNGQMVVFSGETEKNKNKEGIPRSMIKLSSSNVMSGGNKASLDLKKSPSKFSSGRDLNRIRYAKRQPIPMMNKTLASAVNNPAALMIDKTSTASGKSSLAESPRISHQDLTSGKSSFKSNKAVEASSPKDLPSEKSLIKSSNAVGFPRHQDLPSEKSLIKSKDAGVSSIHLDLPSAKSRFKSNNEVKPSSFQDLHSEKSRLKSNKGVGPSNHQDLRSEKSRFKSNNGVKPLSLQDLHSEKSSLKSPGSNQDLQPEKSLLKSNKAVDYSSHLDLPSEKSRLKSNNAVESSGNQDLPSEKRRLKSKTALESSSDLMQKCMTTELKKDCVKDGKNHVEHSADVVPAIKKTLSNAVAGSEENASLRNATLVAFLRHIAGPNSAIPEPVPTWRGRFEISRGEKHAVFCDGFQAHLSCQASRKVLDVVKKLPRKLHFAETPRLSSWPAQFVKSGPREDNIALYFFAKDIESYNKSFKSLVNCMMKKDFCLVGNFEGFELLIFSSNLLPESGQRWNQMFYLWGVFRGKKPADKLPSGQTAGTSSMKEPARLDTSTPAAPPSEKMLSAGQPNEKFAGNAQQTINSVTVAEVPALTAEEMVEASETKITAPEEKSLDPQTISNSITVVEVPAITSEEMVEVGETKITSPEEKSLDPQTISNSVTIVGVPAITSEKMVEASTTKITSPEEKSSDPQTISNSITVVEVPAITSEEMVEVGETKITSPEEKSSDLQTISNSITVVEVPPITSEEMVGVSETKTTSPEEKSSDQQTISGQDVDTVDEVQMKTGDVPCNNSTQQEQGETNAKRGLEIDLNVIDLNDSLLVYEDAWNVDEDEPLCKKLKRPFGETFESGESSSMADAKNSSHGFFSGIDAQGIDAQGPPFFRELQKHGADYNMAGSSAAIVPETDQNRTQFMPPALQQFPFASIDLNKVDDAAHDMPGFIPIIDLEADPVEPMFIDLNKIDDDIPASPPGIDLELERARFEAKLHQAREAQNADQLRSRVPDLNFGPSTEASLTPPSHLKFFGTFLK